MGIVTGMLKLFFGTKSEKDRKEIEPYVEKIKAVYPLIEQLTNDELRARSAALQAAIAQHIAGDEAQIVELKAQLENVDTSLDDKENISRQIDHLTEEIDRKIEEKLDEILPEAFAIMKDTGPPVCTEQRDRSDRDRFRPQPGRRKGLRPYRRRQSHLQ